MRFNLLTYLIEHRDAREGNFLISSVGSRPVVFPVDNGEAFGHVPYNFFVQNWDVILVPALRRESLDRLSRLTRAPAPCSSCLWGCSLKGARVRHMQVTLVGRLARARRHINPCTARKGRVESA